MFEGFLAAGGEDEKGTLLGEALGKGETDAARGTRDPGYFAREVAGRGAKVVGVEVTVGAEEGEAFVD